MKKFLQHILLCLLAALCPAYASAQVLQRAESFIRSAFNAADSAAAAPSSAADSVAMLQLQIQEMKLNEIMLLAKLDSASHHSQTADSLRAAMQLARIDSLRAQTPGVPVVVDGDTLLTLYANRGGYSPFARAQMVADNLARASKDSRLSRDTLYTLDYDGYVDIMLGDQVIMSISDTDAMWQRTTRYELAAQYLPALEAKISSMRRGHTSLGIALRVLMFIIVVAAQWALFKLTNRLFRRLRRRIVRLQDQKLRPVYIREYELLNKRQMGRMLLVASNIVRYFVLLLQLMLSVPLLFAIFPQTEALALNILLYILSPVKMVASAVVDYIPNLFIILVIWFCIKYLIRGLRYITGEIESEKLKISGFYPDWARPTFNIVRFLLYAFMIAMIYPYLPGADSGVFQGISVFVGLIVSLGSSTVIGNIIAGLVITYMRPFKLGDRIKLNDTTGNVIEKTAFVTRLRTPKNEVVTIPNSFIMSSHTVNYSASARQFGLIIHTSVTIGYDVPWRQVHQLLINAARMTPGVLADPKPFVLETELQDYYPCYQINAYIKDADRYGDILTALHQNIQDTFAEAGVEIMSPRYVATRDGSASTIPPAPSEDQ